MKNVFNPKNDQVHDSHTGVLKKTRQKKLAHTGEIYSCQRCHKCGFQEGAGCCQFFGHTDNIKRNGFSSKKSTSQNI